MTDGEHWDKYLISTGISICYLLRTTIIVQECCVACLVVMVNAHFLYTVNILAKSTVKYCHWKTMSALCSFISENNANSYTNLLCLKMTLVGVKDPITAIKQL